MAGVEEGREVDRLELKHRTQLRALHALPLAVPTLPRQQRRQDRDHEQHGAGLVRHAVLGHRRRVRGAASLVAHVAGEALADVVEGGAVRPLALGSEA